MKTTTSESALALVKTRYVCTPLRRTVLWEQVEWFRYSRVSTERVGPSYGTLPNIRRGGGSSSSNFERQNSRRSGQRGSGYDRDRNDNRDRGGYSGRQSGGYYSSSGGGSLQKSDSYSHRNWDSPQPAPIRYILVFHSSSSSLSSFLNISPFSRSQTTDANHTPFGRSHRDSVESNRRFDSRASSRMSINEVNEPVRVSSDDYRL